MCLEVKVSPEYAGRHQHQTVWQSVRNELLLLSEELNIKNLDKEIYNFTKTEEKQASQAIQKVTGIGNASS
ncbi:hypothetical protein HMPREF1548_04099 [Clostridium sp. KLE 1755]|jgi:Holliday junction resolvasome RuvABC DNA-binding subunit|nr:hypothetical protein HMPREF1548_04099 [Clostridium sp. KLE 1755]